jgi:hypothetical protein
VLVVGHGAIHGTVSQSKSVTSRHMSPLFADHLNSLVLFHVKLGPPSASLYCLIVDDSLCCDDASIICGDYVNYRQGVGLLRVLPTKSVSPSPRF